jgi:hypothetical protein
VHQSSPASAPGGSQSVEALILIIGLRLWELTTRYLVTWDASQLKGSPFPLLREDKQKGALVDFGEFPSGGRGFAIVNVENQWELFLLLDKYRSMGIRFLTAEPVLSLEQMEEYAKRRSGGT